MLSSIPKPILFAGLLAAAVVGVVVFRSGGARKTELQLAEADVANRDFAAAVERLEKYLDRRPDSADAHLLAAQAARRAGRRGGTALGRLRDPRRRPGHGRVGAGDAPVPERRPDRGRRRDKVRRGEPGRPARHGHRDPAVRLELAKCRRQLGDTAAAAAVLDELLAARPDDAAVLTEAGALALARGRPADAEPLLRKSLALQPDRRDPTALLARCLQELGRGAEALELLDKMQKIEDDWKRRRGSRDHVPPPAAGPRGRGAAPRRRWGVVRHAAHAGRRRPARTSARRNRPGRRSLKT